VPTLYRKIEDLKTERDRLKSDLESLTGRDNRSGAKDDQEIGQAIAALKSLGKALAKTRPEETKELLSSIVSKIELNYDHHETENGRTRNTFRDGTIYVRPDAGEARSTDPKSTHMTNKRPINETKVGLPRLWSYSDSGQARLLLSIPAPDREKQPEIKHRGHTYRQCGATRFRPGAAGSGSVGPK